MDQLKENQFLNMCSLTMYFKKYAISIHKRTEVYMTNKKEAVCALHKDQIMKASEKLFTEKGYDQTTIDEISKKSEYSRRTIYVYYESKKDILDHIVEKGLIKLKTDIEEAISLNSDFISTYQAIFQVMNKYQKETPHSVENVNHASSSKFDITLLSNVEKRILQLGSDINSKSSELIEKGKENGVIR